MIDQKVAEMLSAQTAMVSALAEALIANGTLDRRDFVKRLYVLLQEAPDRGPSSRTAPIRHLIKILETD